MDQLNEDFSKCFLHEQRLKSTQIEPINNKKILLFCRVRPGAVLHEYTRVRVPDDHAIADLAMYNYIEVII